MLQSQSCIVAVDTSGCLALFCAETADQLALYKDVHEGAASALCTAGAHVRTASAILMSRSFAKY
jgi:hypothetical protein